MTYDSELIIASQSEPGVEYRLARMSFGRRMESTQRIRELWRKVEFLIAGSDPAGKLEAAVLAGEIDRLYVLWALREIRGLTIDGSEATPESFVAAGPETLFHEVLSAVKAECGLGEAEIKN
jgi:hypothetical protein